MTPMLPNELWDTILGYLPGRELWRLRVLNRIFLYNALKFHYGVLRVSQTDWRLPKHKMRHLSQVHTLELILGSSGGCGGPGSMYHWIRLRLFGRLMKRLSHRVSPLQHLRVRYQTCRLPCFSHLDVAWANFCTTIVSLTVDITHHALVANIPPSIYCPNVRKLVVRFLESTSKLPSSPSKVIDRLFRLVPAQLDHLALDFSHLFLKPMVTDDLPPLHKFDQLRTFSYVGLVFTDPPVELNQLIRSNISTLRNLQICHWIPGSWALPIEFVPRFGHSQLTVLCIQVYGQLAWDLEGFMHELSHCSGLVSFELASRTSGRPGLLVLLDALRASSASLRCFKFQVTHLTGEDVLPLLVDIGRSFPKLNYLTIRIFDYHLSGQTGDYLETRWIDDQGHLALHFNGLVLLEVADAADEMIAKAFERCVGHAWQTEVEFPVSWQLF